MAGRMRIGHVLMAMHAYYNNCLQSRKHYASLIRAHATELINIHLKPSDRIKPVQLWEFPWDNEVNENYVTEDKAQRQFEFLEKAMKKLQSNG